MRATTRLALILSVPVSLGAQNATPQVDLKALADSVAPTGTTLERTRALVHWVNDNFTWSYTDYVKRTPQEIVASLYHAIKAGLETPDVKEKMATLGFDPIVTTPDVFATRIRGDIEKWAKVISLAHIKPE